MDQPHRSFAATAFFMPSVHLFNKEEFDVSARRQRGQTLCFIIGT
jgi:hypothetical protein